MQKKAKCGDEQTDRQQKVEGVGVTNSSVKNLQRDEKGVVVQMLSKMAGSRRGLFLTDGGGGLRARRYLLNAEVGGRGQATRWEPTWQDGTTGRAAAHA